MREIIDELKNKVILNNDDKLIFTNGSVSMDDGNKNIGIEIINKKGEREFKFIELMKSESEIEQRFPKNTIFSISDNTKREILVSTGKVIPANNSAQFASFPSLKVEVVKF